MLQQEIYKYPRTSKNSYNLVLWDYTLLLCSFCQYHCTPLRSNDIDVGCICQADGTSLRPGVKTCLDRGSSSLDLQAKCGCGVPHQAWIGDSEKNTLEGCATSSIFEVPFFRNPIPTAAWPPPGLFGSSTDRSPRLPGLNLEAFGCHRSDVNALADYGLRFQQDMRTGRGDPCSTDEKGGGLKGARVGERWVTALWGWK